MSDKIGEKSFLRKCEASLEIKAEPRLEKKDFISEKKHCIIRKIVNNVVMSFKSNSVQVVCLSVLGFCAGVLLTCVLITARRPDTKHGVGGLETAAEPEYEENLSTLLADVDAAIDLANVEAPEAAEVAEADAANENAKLNGLDNIRFVFADATQYISELAFKGERFDTVIMDPPRAGSTQQFISAVASISPQKVVYVSCRIETLERDLKVFRKCGYTVKLIQPIDMFPHTTGIETVVLLNKK